MKITYIDLGLHKEAFELRMFIKICQDLGVEYNAYGFEANPDYKFTDIDATIYNKAISNKNETVKLYLDEHNGQGNSIFASKYNVNVDNYREVESIVFSEWFDEIYNPENIHILRFNIEGAEWYLMNDIIKNGLHNKIDLFLGAAPDIHKVKELKPIEETYNKMLSDNNIKVYNFCQHLKTNLDLKNWIDENTTNRN